MSKIYIIMETIDLGGHPVRAFSELAKAEAVCNEMNRADTEEHIKALMKNCGYSEEMAIAYANRNTFYIEEVSLDD